ncbi:MAG: endonuclease [Muribaculaceae bacterium]|nr:endonuclease [Muribaculaceae bacterium]
MKITTPNKLFATVLLVISVMTLPAFADVPTGYYNTLNGKSGQALKNAIHELTKVRTVHDYSSLWFYFRETDCMKNDHSRVWDMYSNKTYYFTSNGTGATSGMNKEHSLPKSWWGGYNESQGYYAYTDLNHLYPSDGDANMAKNNYPLGEVSTVKFDNGVSKTGNPVAGQGGGSSIVFEPANEYKGDFARTYFYMAACYQDYTWKYKYMYTEDNWLTLTPWSIDLLLRWAREDPVSDKEITRNEAVYKCQNNRNPFIDNPELMEYIWGDRYGDVFNVGNTEPTDDLPPEIITPTNDMVFDLGQVALGKSTSITIPVKGHNLTNNVNLMLYRYEYQMFELPVTSIDRATANSESGYPLTVTYKPTELGLHRARLVFSDGGFVGSFGISLMAECLEVPTLSTPVVLDPLEVTNSGYTAVWEPATEEVDYFIVNRTIYDENHNIIDSEMFATDDANQTSMTFTDRKHHEIHTYTVQSYRLGYTSEPSRVITIDVTGVSDIQADLPMAFIPGEGYVLIKCGTPLKNVRIYNTSGQLVASLPEVTNDTELYLPMGIYILTTSSNRIPAKLIIR